MFLAILNLDRLFLMGKWALSGGDNIHSCVDSSRLLLPCLGSVINIKGCSS